MIVMEISSFYVFNRIKFETNPLRIRCLNTDILYAEPKIKWLFVGHCLIVFVPNMYIVQN